MVYSCLMHKVSISLTSIVFVPCVRHCLDVGGRYLYSTSSVMDETENKPRNVNVPNDDWCYGEKINPVKELGVRGQTVLLFR